VDTVQLKKLAATKFLIVIYEILEVKTGTFISNALALTSGELFND
jgi:hypothetical protein